MGINNAILRRFSLFFPQRSLLTGCERHSWQGHANFYRLIGALRRPHSSSHLLRPGLSVRRCKQRLCACEVGSVGLQDRQA